MRAMYALHCFIIVTLQWLLLTSCNLQQAMTKKSSVQATNAILRVRAAFPYQAATHLAGSQDLQAL